MLEAYQAYGDYHTMMELSETLVRECARAVNPIMGRPADDLVIPVRGHMLDLAEPFSRITVLGAVSEAVGEEVTLEHPDLRGLAKRHEVHVEDAWGPGKIVQELFEKLVEETIVQPTFVCDFPREVSPLARPHRDEPAAHRALRSGRRRDRARDRVQRAHRPDEQRAKFELQQQMKEVLGDEVHPFDEDFLRALEHGMPPAGGLGMGIDRLLLLLMDAQNLRELIMFPTLRPE